jgi:hypothetical protein
MCEDENTEAWTVVVMEFQMPQVGRKPRGNDHHSTYIRVLKEEIILMQVRKFVPTRIVVGIDSCKVFKRRNVIPCLHYEACEGIRKPGLRTQHSFASF